MVLPENKNWFPPVLACSSIIKNGTSAVWDTILVHQKIMRKNGEFELKRKQQAVQWMWKLLETGLKTKFQEDENIISAIPKISQRVHNGKVTSSFAADELLALFYKSISKQGEGI